MIVKNLYENVLLKPINEGADSLLILSGYATATMAYRHIESLKEINNSVNINLIIGMCSSEGIKRKNHLSFKKLATEHYPNIFNCNYLIRKPAIHTKFYIWLSNNNPVIGFIGSANYTQIAFSDQRRECLVEYNPAILLEYYNEIMDETIACGDDNVEDLITIYDEDYYRKAENIDREELTINKRSISNYSTLSHVRVDLRTRSGNLGARSGLNWGQRPGREPNQAYIRLSSTVYNSDFFPNRPEHFTVLTDDGKILTCVRAQDNAKAIHTPQNNSLIGEYFRNRLSVQFGNAVTLEDLERYGRTHIDFYKIDEETFFMDFSLTENG